MKIKKEKPEKKSVKTSAKTTASSKFQKPLKGPAKSILPASKVPVSQAKETAKKIAVKVNETLNAANNKASFKKNAKAKTAKENRSKVVVKHSGAVKRALDGKTAPKELPPSKKPKLEEMKKKDRKVARKSLRNNYELSKKAKRLWEAVRREDCPKQAQNDLCQELYNLLKDNIKELVFAHDTARVIECLVLLGSDQIRKDLYDALKGDLPLLMKSKYAKHFVMKMLKHGSKEQRNNIIKAMYGSITKLIRHTEAANVVEFAYNDFANAQQRACMSEEFYGPTFALFKDNEIKSLAGILAKDPRQKDAILSHLKETLNSVVDKSVIKHSLIHHILLEYLLHCSPRDRTEMIESIREHVVEILHTKDGARIGMQCIWHGTAKDRKIIIKSMKSHVYKICTEEHGLFVLLAIFDCVDDTKLVHQALIEELLRHSEDLAFHLHGRKVLLYLVAPRNKTYFHPQFIGILEQGDGNTTSKKDCGVRRKEHLMAVSAKLLKLVADNAEKMVLGPASSIVAQAILMYCLGNPQAAFEKISECAEKPFVAGDTSNPHIIEHTPGHMLIKRLLQNDKAKADEPEAVLFSRVLLDLIPSSTLPSWIDCNRGCFTLLLLLKTEIPAVEAKVRMHLKSSMGKISTLQKKFKGAEFLYAALKEHE